MTWQVWVDMKVCTKLKIFRPVQFKDTANKKYATLTESMNNGHAKLFQADHEVWGLGYLNKNRPGTGLENGWLHRNMALKIFVSGQVSCLKVDYPTKFSSDNVQHIDIIL